ncbi:MAG: carboxypeptidase-like regulatory domain-containing protein [Planctomycetota bacterium]
MAGAPTTEGSRNLARVRVIGRVVDEQQAPIEGAEIFGHDEQEGLHRIARSDGSGAFEGELGRSAYFQFRIFAPAHARAEVTFMAETRDVLDLGTIVLGPGGDVRGRVVQEGGGAPASASVALTPASEFPAEASGPAWNKALELTGDDWANAIAVQPDGSFELRGVAPGEWFAKAESPGGNGASRVFSLTVGASVEVDVLVPRADESHWIDGRVFGPGGEALDGVALTLQEDTTQGLEALGYSGPDDATSARDGRFCFALQQPGFFLLRARDPRQRGADLVLQNVASGRRGLELRLAPVPWIEVRLIDERGSAIAWGNVWGSGSDSPVAMTPLGERGVGRIPFVGSELRLEADAPGFARKRFGPYRSLDLQHGLELVLAPGGFVRGRVTSAGRPVKGARLDFSWARPPGEAQLAQGTTPDGWPFVVTNHVNVSGQDGTSDGDGRFVLSVPGAGWHALRVEADGLPLTVFGPWELDPARASPELALELVPGGVLEGRVLLPAGESPLGRYVGVSNGWSFAHTTAVDAEGRYRFADLAPGGWQVRPVSPPVASLQALEVAWEGAEFEFEPDVEIRPGGRAHFDLDLVPSHGCALRGHIRFEGVELGGWVAVLFASGKRGSKTSVATSALEDDGAFRVVAPKAGAYELRIWSQQGAAFIREVQLTGVETSLELSFARATASLERAPDEDQYVRLHGTCPDGTRFEVWTYCGMGRDTWRADVPPGTYKAQRDKEWSEPFELAPGEERMLPPTAP